MMLLDRHVITTPLDRVRPLLLPEIPAPGESLLGFISRSLARTAVQRLSPGLALAGIGTLRPESLPRTLDDPRQVASLARFFGTTSDEVEARLYRTTSLPNSDTVALSYNQVPIRLVFREGKVRRVSPLALRRSAIHRAVWELRPFTFDPETMEHLLDTCPVCSKKLSWARAGRPEMCDHCFDRDRRHSVDLRDFPQPLVEVDDAAALTLAPRLLSHDPSVRSDARRSVAAPFSDLSVAELFETIMSISFSLSRDSAQQVGLDLPRRRSDVTALSPALLCRVSRSMLEGRQAFDTLLEELRLGREDRKGYFGHFVEFGQVGHLRKNPHMSPAARAVVYDAMGRVLETRPMKRRFRPDRQRPEGFVDLVEAASNAGISGQCMKKIVSANLVEVRRGGHRGLARWVKSVDVITVAAELNAALPDFQIERRLGIDRHQFRSLELAGLLTRPRAELRPLLPIGTNYTAASVEALLAQLQRPLEYGVAGIPIAEAVLELGIDPPPWAAILAVVATGFGYGISTVEGAPDWRADTLVVDVEGFCIDVAKVVVDSPVAGQTVSASDAAEILGTTVNFVCRVAKLGALGKVPGRPARFDRQAILRFREQHIYGSALASHFGVSNNNAIRRRLAEQNVLPAFPDIRRDLIYHRAGLPVALA